MANLSTLPDLVGALRDGTAALTARNRPTLIDSEGLGKPYSFDSKREEDFQRWSRKVESFITAVYPSAVGYLQWA
eukprot:8310729-Prorocentrum_lima.AAC.1